ncbi:MAG: hypothetical protein WBF81_08735 [Thermoplasmata archaeon]
MTWDSFFTAEVGASAALAGLIFVGISINLQRIIALPMIANRALQALLILVGSLGIESLLLVPGQSTTEQGVEVLAVALALLAALDWIEWRSWHEVDPAYERTLRAHSLQIQFPCGFAIVGAVLLLVADPAAVYWFVPATLTSFLVAIVEAWVITVEIVR